MPILAAIHKHVISMLGEGLPGSLTYHDVHHTVDVTAQCMAIARIEGITDVKTLEELEIAALYHDSGFLYTYENHEERGCEIAREQLPGFGVDRRAIVNICALIMATKVPQNPHTELEKIICDADLDYLGRSDFFEIGDKLRRELIEYKFINGDHDWERRQLIFLQQHHYFTKTSREKRTPTKLKFIRQLVMLSDTATK